MKKIKSTISGINLIAIAIVINVLLAFYPFLRIDVSENKIHSLSKATKEVVRGLDDVVNVKVYVTSDLPLEIRPVANSMRTILEEVSRLNQNKLRVTYHDPLKNEDDLKQADNYGIQPLQFSSVKSDKFEVQNGYFGLAMVYGDKQEVLPVAGDVGNLEYFLVSSIKKLTSGKKGVVLLADGSMESGGSQISYLRKFLEQIYNIEDIDLTKEEDWPGEAQNLVIFGQKSTIEEKTLEKIREWIEQGKGTVIFQDSVAVDQNLQTTRLEDNGLEKILSDQGMKLSKSLVTDESAAIANFNSQQGMFLTRYKYWPLVLPEKINYNIPALSGINSLTLAWASPIEIDGDVLPLFESSDLSSVDSNIVNINPSEETKVSGDKKSSVMGAIRTESRKLALISDSDFIRDQFVVNNQQNLLVALNLIDYFSQDSSLLGIRSKVMKTRPLKIVDESVKNIIKAGVVLYPIGLLAISSQVINSIRKKKNLAEND